MQWGLFYLPTSLPSTPVEGARLYRTIIEQARYAEALGFHSVWLAEHHFQTFGGMFPSTPLIGTAIAQHTTKIRIDVPPDFTRKVMIETRKLRPPQPPRA